MYTKNILRFDWGPRANSQDPKIRIPGLIMEKLPQITSEIALTLYSKLGYLV